MVPSGSWLVKSTFPPRYFSPKSFMLEVPIPRPSLALVLKERLKMLCRTSSGMTVGLRTQKTTSWSTRSHPRVTTPPLGVASRAFLVMLIRILFNKEGSVSTTMGSESPEQSKLFSAATSCAAMRLVTVFSVSKEWIGTRSTWSSPDSAAKSFLCWSISSMS